jgi:hypothetical protein
VQKTVTRGKREQTAKTEKTGDPAGPGGLAVWFFFSFSFSVFFFFKRKTLKKPK